MVLRNRISTYNITDLLNKEVYIWTNKLRIHIQPMNINENSL